VTYNRKNLVSRSLVAAALSGAIATSAIVSNPTGAGANTGETQPAAAASIAEVRRATAQYHDPAVAVADGFVPTEECAAHPELGGMGLHYLNPARLADPAVIATQPEILLYEPQADGTLRLVGVEWFSADPDQDLSTDGGRPELLGVAFDGPMPGHEPGMPIHFDLHAWIWKHNPAGQFTAWNPAVSCGG
jgi:hypothetical protein